MKNQTSTLVRELLSLYLRYGPEVFEAATRELQEGHLTNIIAEASERLLLTARDLRPRGARVRASTHKKSKQELAAEFISRLSGSDYAPDQRLANFLERISRRQMLASPHSLRDYMSLIGIPIGDRHIDRHDAIRRIGTYLRDLPEAERQERMQAADSIQDQVSSLQKWTDIIVKPDTQGR